MPFKDGVFGDVEIPRKHYNFLTDRTPGIRFRAIYGGRNGAKDHSIVRFLVEYSLRKKMRMLFTREVQKSLASSSKQLVEDVVTDLGYRAFFDILRDEVRSKPNGSKFEFSGLNDIVVGDLKSYEGVDIAVICEAENLTRNTFENFNQTIRKPGSEIWIVFNPQYEDDFVCDLCINNPPKNMISLQVNGYALAPDNKTVIKADNPFITDTMIGEAQRLHDTDLALFEKDCLGIPRGEGGRIYPMYNKDLHEVNFPLSELSKCDLYMSIDPTPKYYPAILWLAVTPTDSVIIYNEYPKFDDLNMFYDDARKTVLFDDKSMKDLANIILANDFDHLHGQRITRTGDPRFFSNDVNYVPALMSHGVHGWVDAPFDKIETHRETIKSFINYNPALPVCGANMPELYVATGDRTKNIRRALERHCWEDKKDEESERFKDFIDALRYFFGIVDGRPRFKQRTTKKHETRIISSRAAVMGGINSDWGDE